VLIAVEFQYNQIPTDSDASIYTQGLLGGKFIGIHGRRRRNLPQGQGSIDFTQSAFVLEDLNRQFLANSAKGSGQSNSHLPKPEPPAPTEKTNMKTTNMKRSTIARGLWPVACHCRARLTACGARRAAPAPNTLGRSNGGDSAKRMLTELDANRPMYAKDPAKLDALVANVMLPNFDSEYSLGSCSPNLAYRTPEQRKRFVDAFYHSLLRNSVLRCSISPRSIRHPALQGDPPIRWLTVRTEVKRSSVKRCPSFSVCAKPDAGWKAWDVVIEVFPTSKSFRTDRGRDPTEGSR